MKTITRFFLVALLAAIVLTACGPKPAPGQTDREHAEDAFGRMK